MVKNDKRWLKQGWNMSKWSKNDFNMVKICLKNAKMSLNMNKIWKSENYSQNSFETQILNFTKHPVSNYCLLWNYVSFSNVCTYACAKKIAFQEYSYGNILIIHKRYSLHLLLRKYSWETSVSDRARVGRNKSLTMRELACVKN